MADMLGKEEGSVNGTLTTVLVATVAFVIGTVIPDQTGVYAALIGGLVTFCAALAGGITALLSADGDMIARASAIGAGAGAAIGFVLCVIDVISR